MRRTLENGAHDPSPIKNAATGGCLTSAACRPVRAVAPCGAAPPTWRHNATNGTIVVARAAANQTCGGADGYAPSPPPGLLQSHSCDPHGVRQGIEQARLPRESIFVTVKYGFAGPMGVPGRLCPPPGCADEQASNMYEQPALSPLDFVLLQ